MKPRILSSLASVSLAFSTCLFSGQSAAAEKASARTIPPESAKASTRSTSVISNQIPVIDIPESVFVANLKDAAAADPFFPSADYVKNSRKKFEPAIQAPLGSTDDAPLKALKVTGVGGVGDKRWAMLNGVTIYMGESATFQVNGKSEKIECLEISETAVTVGIKGTETRREIKLN